jgi:hypothetical protein
MEVRLYNTYYFENSALTSGAWKRQTSPAAPTAQQALEAVAEVMTALTDNNSECCQYVQGSAVLNKYRKDTSAFACSASFFGQGNTGRTGPYRRIESEVPIKSPILGCFCSEATGDERSSRFLKTSSGDSTVALGLGCLRDFHLDWYKTVYPPIYKFIDIYEVVYMMVYWYQSLIAQAATYWKDGVRPEVGVLLGPFTCTARQFALTVRQCIMSLFNDTQALTQFLIPNGESAPFEALRIGSNTYGKNLRSNMIVPSLLREY